MCGFMNSAFYKQIIYTYIHNCQDLPSIFSPPTTVALHPSCTPFAEGLWSCPVQIHRHQEREGFLHCVPCAQMDMALGLMQ